MFSPKDLPMPNPLQFFLLSVICVILRLQGAVPAPRAPPA